MTEEACKNTDREIWREREGDYYADSIHVTVKGAIGINCGGTVYTKPVRDWHALASASPAPDGEEVESVAEALRLAGIDWSCKPHPKEPYWQFMATAAISAMRPTLSEEDRARVKEVGAWLAENAESDASTSMDSLQAAYACDHLTELLSLIDKLTEAG